MSCCEVSGTNERITGTGCCGSICSSGKGGCLTSDPHNRSCVCQTNVGCLDRDDRGGFRPGGTAATGACPGPCQCAEEEAWNINIPPKPNCEWLSNFSELRRQWSDHSRPDNCKCCNCVPYRKAASCKPCSKTATSFSGNTGSSRNGQDCCKDLLSGGGSAPRSKKTSSSIRCSPPNYNSLNHSFEPYPSPRECPEPSLPTRQPPSSCQPCSPSARPIVLKKKSCCQCTPGYCMCQRMPRNCNCPPPVHVDARAQKECSCDCPSSPECACAPSERRFTRTKLRCPNAKLCCPLPRLPPGPKCLCSECKPCLPVPCDLYTSRKCKTIPPNMTPCQGDFACPTSAPCRPGSPTKSSRLSYTHPSREQPPCTSCRKMSSTYRDNCDEPLQSQVRIMNRSGSSHSRSGQSLDPCDVADGDEDGVVEIGKFSQCNCSSKVLGREKLCNFSCLKAADDVGVAVEDNMIKLNWNSRTRESLKRKRKFVDPVCSSSLKKSFSSNTSSVTPNAESASSQKGKPTSSVTSGRNSCQFSTATATPEKTMPKIRLFDRLQAQTKRLNFSKINKILKHT